MYVNSNGTIYNKDDGICEKFLLVVMGGIRTTICKLKCTPKKATQTIKLGNVIKDLKRDNTIPHLCKSIRRTEGKQIQPTIIGNTSVCDSCSNKNEVGHLLIPRHVVLREVLSVRLVNIKNPRVII